MVVRFGASLGCKVSGSADGPQLRGLYIKMISMSVGSWIFAWPEVAFDHEVLAGASRRQQDTSSRYAEETLGGHSSRP